MSAYCPLKSTSVKMSVNGPYKRPCLASALKELEWRCFVRDVLRFHKRNVYKNKVNDIKFNIAILGYSIFFLIDKGILFSNFIPLKILIGKGLNKHVN